MSSDDIEPFGWYRRSGGLGRRGFGEGFFDDMFSGFDEMTQEMQREFEDLEERISKDMISEYTTSEGGKIKDVGTMVYGYSMAVGPDGNSRIRGFGNVKPSRGYGFRSLSRPEISGELEPLVDVTTTDNEIRVVVEMPRISKENIKINAYDNTVEVKSQDPRRKYHRTVEIPPETDIETATSTYNNGILEITFKKKPQTKGRTITIE
jgi:HSP20 family protein